MGATHAGADGIAGDFRIHFNTFWNFSNGATSLAIGSPGGNGLNPIATMEIVGNIARRVASLCHVYCKDWYDCDSDVSHQPIRIYGLPMGLIMAARQISFPVTSTHRKDISSPTVSGPSTTVNRSTVRGPTWTAIYNRPAPPATWAPTKLGRSFACAACRSCTEAGAFTDLWELPVNPETNSHRPSVRPPAVKFALMADSAGLPDNISRRPSPNSEVDD